jgi:hypothetical protein
MERVAFDFTNIYTFRFWILVLPKKEKGEKLIEPV